VNYKYPNTAILVFCKAPIAGQVKTRLIPDLSAEQACDVHIELSHRTLQLLSAPQLCPVQLWCAPDTTHSFFRSCADNYHVSLHQQQGEDLGDRMLHAIADALTSYSSVLLIGCDCPSLTVDDIECAIMSLEHNDIALAPAEDGGYVMIGMNQVHPDVFINMTWGNDAVLSSTRKRIESQNLSLAETNTQWDVDTIADYHRYLNRV